MTAAAAVLRLLLAVLRLLLVLTAHCSSNTEAPRFPTRMIKISWASVVWA
jgi:hypothetical protein